jgi:YHS domain-containing protein
MVGKPSTIRIFIFNQTSRWRYKMAKDHVCGMEVDEKNPGAITEYQVKTYYFCCGGCKASFDRNPEKYLGDQKGHPDTEHHRGH